MLMSSVVVAALVLVGIVLAGRWLKDHGFQIVILPPIPIRF
jgi:hypothetical protein